jgi:hypothetical protein
MTTWENKAILYPSVLQVEDCFWTTAQAVPMEFPLISKYFYDGPKLEDGRPQLDITLNSLEDSQHNNNRKDGGGGTYNKEKHRS